jgi:uncharacterized membrane protein
MWLTFLFFLALGLIVARHRLTAAAGIDKLIILGPIFAASPLALFGAEHLTNARAIMQGVPSWMPGHLFWAYVVGFALLATGVSLSLMRYTSLSSLLTAAMIFLFVLMLHVPRVIANPHDRFSWAVALRDSCFAAGFLAFGGAQSGRFGKWMVAVGRVAFGIVILFFAAEHFLHPASAPGVPLEKITPAWFPLPALWSYLTGAVLLIAGIALLINRRARMGAAGVGLAAALLTLFLYTPILIVSIHHGAQVPELIEGLNYVGDTLFFAGTALLLAAAIPVDVKPLQAI